MRVTAATIFLSTQVSALNSLSILFSYAVYVHERLNQAFANHKSEDWRHSIVQSMSVNDYAVASHWYLGEIILPQELGTELILEYPEYEHLAKTWSAVPDGAHWGWEAGFKEIKAPEEGGLESAVEVRYAFTHISSVTKRECTNIFLGETPCDDFIVSPNMQRQQNGSVSVADSDEK